MTGLELARAYWEACGVPMIRDQFPEYEEIIAAALTGSGSECYGFDDEQTGGRLSCWNVRMQSCRRNLRASDG